MTEIDTFLILPTKLVLVSSTGVRTSYKHEQKRSLLNGAVSLDFRGTVF